MKTLTICQPWAAAIIRGWKRTENRTWTTAYRGPLAIHAGKSRRYYDAEDPEGWPDLYGGLELPPAASLAWGAVLGVVELLDCVRLQDLPQELRAHPFAEGPICWILADPHPLTSPVPHAGQQGLWDVPDDLLLAAALPSSRGGSIISR